MSGYPQQTYSGYPQQAYGGYPQQQGAMMMPQTNYQPEMMQGPQMQW